MARSYTRPVRRGRLRIYLGAAPGVGKTFAMLGEGRRRAARGTDVVVAYVETHGRANTATQVGDLEVIPRRTIAYRDATLEEMDLAAVLARHPDVALVDELAHTNAPGAGNEKRWHDVYELLDAGIDVITTVNVQHLESLNDVVERITGVRQRETVPDHVVREADQVELVDMTPEALRRRMAHGNIYAADKVDAALANYFRPGNLTALRELALLWVADKVDEALQQYMDVHGIEKAWEARERVVVAVTGAPSGEPLIRRAARMAQRSHGELVGVHLRSADGLTSGPSELLVAHQQLLADLGGEYREVVAADVAQGLVDFARSVHATQLVLGATRRSRWDELVHGSVVNDVLRRAGDIDVHVISQPVDGDATERMPARPVARRRRSHLSARREATGWLLAIGGGVALTGILLAARDAVAFSTVLLVYLLLVGGVALIGGLRPALAAAVGADLAANWWFTEPYETLRIDDPEQVVSLVAFIVLAAVISLLVEQSAARSAQANRARAEAATLAAAGGLAATGDPLAAMVGHLQVAFEQLAVAVLRQVDDGWVVEASSGEPAPVEPTGESVALGDHLELCLVPGGLTPDDERVLRAFAGRITDVLDRRSLEEVARHAEARSRADQLRTAILRAVSHDLRTPLASIKASSTSLLQDDIAWTADEIREFARTIDEEADRLTRLVEDLLDMSRIEAGAVRTATRAVGLDDAIAGALASLSQPTDRVRVHIASDLPGAVADPGLLERVIANLVANALDHTADGTDVLVEAAATTGRAVVRIIDHGPGIEPEERTAVFEAFQRLGDATPGGVGLGMAVARGFIEAMDGELLLDETPGGGLTVSLSLPLANTPTPIAEVR